uniref:Expansin-A15-like n=1 Tax=Saccoglossus kowalevskii TaxID=10224 RepID=A0ABM0M824_SACKO|nr:PREDICTED: expansin-A15-like [Saccoglossus kowalevskii]
MDVFLRFLVFVLVFAFAQAACNTSEEIVHGDATFYSWADVAAAGKGACGYDVTNVGYTMEIAAIDSGRWDDSKSCGMCIEITGPTGDTLEVIVVDQCMTCTDGSLDLSEKGFTAISGGKIGMAEITWKEIECPVLRNVGFIYSFVYANENANAAFQMRIFNHLHKIRTVERRHIFEGESAPWFELPRGSLGNFGVPREYRKLEKPFQMRITSDVTGEVLTEEINKSPENGVRDLIEGKSAFTSLCPGSLSEASVIKPPWTFLLISSLLMYDVLIY